MSISRWRLSRAAQLMCGVMMQFFAVSSGLSGRIGSTETTSSPAAYTRPRFSASAKSCSITSGPRPLLMRMTPGFIRSMLCRLMRPSVCGVSGQFRLITSAFASSSSSGT